MNKKLIMTAAALLALTTVAGCEIKSGGNGSASNAPSDSSVEDTYATVTFDLNYAGAPAAQTVQVEKGDYIDAPEDPVREGYFFNGWYETQDASGLEFDFFLTSIEDDLTLYADWTPAYVVTFYLNKPEATEDEVYETQSVKAEALATRPADPKVSRFSFGGWFKTAACLENDEFNFATPITADLNLYAKWQEPDWKVISDAVANYLGFVSSVEGVTVPQFPNSDYAFDDRYSNALVITAPEKCLTEYKPVLEAAGYTVTEDEETHIVKAVNDFITLEMGEDESRGDETFRMLLKINGAGESTTFGALPYQIGTQQNFISLPDAALALFNKYEVYKGKLTTGDACASVSLYFDAKPADSTLTDEEYYNQKLAAFKSALGTTKYSVGYFTDTGGMYFYDKAYLTMNQVYAYDATTPLKIDLLSYSYCALYANGITFNKVDKDVFAAASATALWKTTAAFDVDLSSIVSTAAANGKNFIVQYDVGTRTPYVEIDIQGVKVSNAGLSGVYTAVLTAVNALEDWELFKDSDNNYYAYHYVKDANNVVKADAKLTLDYDTSARAVTGGMTVSIVLNPVDTEWDADAVAEYFAVQALPGDESALPAYTGTFAFIEMEASEYGDYFDIYMKYTDATEAQAYLQSLLAAPYNYSYDGADTDGGLHFTSASKNFEIIAFVGQNSLEIVINAAPVKSCEWDNNALATINATLEARNAFSMPAAAVALLTADYVGINYYSYFDFEDNAGYSVVKLVSTVTEAAAEGETTKVEDDAAALIAYFQTVGFTYNATKNTLVKDGTTLVIEATAPTADDPSFLEFTVIGNPPVELDNGHVIQYSSTVYVADNGDAFLMGVGYNAILNIDAPYYNYYVKGKVEASKLPSLYAALPNAEAYVKTTLYLSSDFSYYDSALLYNYWLTTKLVDETAEKEVLTAAAAAYEAALKTAGFVAAVNGIFNSEPEGFWCAASGEFVQVLVDGENNEITVDVYFVGAQMRNYIRAK